MCTNKNLYIEKISVIWYYGQSGQNLLFYNFYKKSEVSKYQSQFQVK